MAARRSVVFFGSALCLAAISFSCNQPPRQKEAKFLKRGEAFLAKEDYARAILEFENASRNMPKDAEPYYQMGLASLETGNFRAAVGNFHKALELNPKHAGAKLRLAGMMTTSADKTVLERAEEQLQDLVGGQDASAEALDTLAVAEWKLGRPEDAAKLVEEAIQKFPSNLSSALLLARFKLARNDAAGAEAVLRQAAGQAPKSPQARLALADFYVRTGKPGQAETELKRALQLDPKYGLALLTLGMLQESQNRLGEAEQTYRQAAQLPDRNYRAAYGLFLFHHGKQEAALAEFQRLAQLDPKDRSARSRLVTAYVLLNKIPAAEKILGSALAKNPNDTDALLQRSQLRLASGDLAGAESDLDHLVRLEPSAEAHFEFARLRHLQGRNLNERQELIQALGLDPGHLAARLALCRNFLLAREYQSALDAINQTPAAQESSLAVLTARNWALLGLGRDGEAREGINVGLRTARTPALLIQDALLKLGQPDYRGALADGVEILRQDPENRQGIAILAASYAGMKQLPKAVASIREMIAQRPKSARLQFALGRVLIASGDRAGARQAFQAAVATDQNFIAARIELAKLDISDNRLDEARQQVNAAIAREPRNLASLLTAADIDIKTGDRGAALKACRTVLEVDDSNVSALNNLAYLLARDDPDEALKFAQRAMELAPDDPAVQDTLGWVYYDKASYQMALTYFKQAAAEAPTPLRRLHLGMAYLKTGDQNLGKRAISAALAQDPNLWKSGQDQ